MTVKTTVNAAKWKQSCIFRLKINFALNRIIVFLCWRNWYRLTQILTDWCQRLKLMKNLLEFSIARQKHVFYKHCIQYVTQSEVTTMKTETYLLSLACTTQSTKITRTRNRIVWRNDRSSHAKSRIKTTETVLKWEKKKQKNIYYWTTENKSWAVKKKLNTTEIRTGAQLYLISFALHYVIFSTHFVSLFDDLVDIILIHFLSRLFVDV